MIEWKEENHVIWKNVLVLDRTYKYEHKKIQLKKYSTIFYHRSNS